MKVAEHQPGAGQPDATELLRVLAAGLSPALLERALRQNSGIRHIVITCNPNGRMAELATRHPDRLRAIILDDAVNDRGLAMTSSFSNMLLAGQCIAQFEELDSFRKIVSQMAQTGEQLLPAAAEVAAAITALGWERACFVGSGALRAVADESA